MPEWRPATRRRIPQGRFLMPDCLHNVEPEYDEEGYLRCPLCGKWVE